MDVASGRERELGRSLRGASHQRADSAAENHQLALMGPLERAGLLRESPQDPADQFRWVVME
jgi:hypothetical protein